METWTFYPIFVATLISMIGLSRIVKTTQQSSLNNQTLSELAVTEERLLTRFRNILVLCGILFAITVFGFLVSRAHDPLLIIVFGSLMIIGELLASLIPASGKSIKVHLALALTMAIGMFGLSATFWLKQTGVLSLLEGVFTLTLGLLAFLSAVDKKRYLTYELGFIFTSHFSLLIAAIALK